MCAAEAAKCRSAAEESEDESEIVCRKSLVPNRSGRRFSSCSSRPGTVEAVKVMKDMATGRSRGFAFVEMSTDEEGAKAIAELNAHQFEGRNLTVNEARPKTEHGGGFVNNGLASRS